MTALSTSPKLSATVTLSVAFSSAGTEDGAANVAFAGLELSMLIIPAVPAICSNSYDAILPVLLLASNLEDSPSCSVVVLADNSASTL